MSESYQTLKQLGLDPDTLRWAVAHGGPLAELWDACPRGDWLLMLATKVGVERAHLVLAGATCAQMSVRLIPPHEERPGLAIRRAVEWSKGASSSAACWAAAFGASSAGDAMALTVPASNAAHAAAHAAFACDAAADDVYYAAEARAAEAARLCAEAFNGRGEWAHLRCADVVRAVIGFDEVEALLPSALRTSLRPPIPTNAPASMDHGNGSFGDEESSGSWFPAR